MKTILHHYYFSLDNATERGAYEALKAQLNESHAGKFFNVLADSKHGCNYKNETEQVDLDPTFLFANQWNEAGGKGRRLFDWYEAIYPNRQVKNGHWLEITPEMAAIREQTLTCGYCGKFVPASEPHKWHCEKCLGSQYLKATDLGLLRLLPVVSKNQDVSRTLTDAERAEILPAYNEAQGLGLITREKALRSRNRLKVDDLLPEALRKSNELVENAKIETKALTWLLDHEINIIDNVIFYTHTQRFCFGWRNPLTPDERSKLLDILSEFPFDYDLK